MPYAFPDNYRSCLARAKRALSAGTFPAATLSMIEDDIATTLPALHIFHHETGPLYPDLKDMLCAWVVSRTDEGLGYKPGAARIAAMLIINIPVQQAFVVMRNLLERHCLRSFFGGDGAKNDVSQSQFTSVCVSYLPARLKVTTGKYARSHQMALKPLLRIFDTLLADGMPKSKQAFKFQKPLIMSFSLLQFQTTPDLAGIISSRLVDFTVPRSPPF